MTGTPENTTLPFRMRNLHTDKHGRIVPWFVHWENGVPDFRVTSAAKLREAVAYNKCWICGDTLGRYATFVIGPMCAVNRITAEPGSHHGCAVTAARECPFLTNPNMTRRSKGLENSPKPPGEMILRNPGVTALWTTREWRLIPHPEGKFLIDLGAPENVRWLTKGRDATREEVRASIDSGMPTLVGTCLKQPNPGPLTKELQQQYEEALQLLPSVLE